MPGVIFWRFAFRVLRRACTLDLVKALGADEVIDYRTEDFSTRIRDLDVVFDTLGGETQTKSFGVLRKGGVLVSIVDPPDRKTPESPVAFTHFEFTRTPSDAGRN